MRFCPKGFCLNDFEIVKEGDQYHLIHLEGPPIHPFNAGILETSYGHATSKDLISWETQAPVFGISQYPHFDDSAIWTMRVIKHQDRLWMFYTGLTQEPMFLQQVGLATDATLTCTKWQRFSEKPILSADARYYQSSGFMAWRDPFVIYDDEDQKWKMYICARTNTGGERKRGCIGYATSDNLTDWEIQPPVLSPGTFEEMECPVLFRHGRYWYMLVSVGDDRKVHAWKSEHTGGPFSYIGPIAPAYNYAPRVVEAPDSELVLLHTVPRRWQAKDDGEYMRGRLAQPKAIRFDDKDDPYLCWYPPVRDHYESENSGTQASGNNLLVIPVDPGSTALAIRTRIRDVPEQRGIELIIENEKATLRYIEDKYELASEPCPHPGAVKEIKLLNHDEYFEVYIDDVLTLTALGYRYSDGRSDVIVNGIEKDCPVYRLKG